MSNNIPEIKESTKFNLFTSIWLVPFVALIIAVSLAYQYFSDLGPEIEIVFPQNEGLVAGQSVVKFKNVPVGKVTAIHINDVSEGVVVTVRMNSDAATPYMTEYAKFWIVKPEVGLTGVSGLDTLLSGTYINIYSEPGGSFKKRHIGLIQPYQDSSKGAFFHLSSQKGRNISVGMPVYYKDIEVGKVEYKYLSLDDKSVEVVVFIENRYVQYVHKHSKFWMQNTMNIDFTKGKLDIDIAPLSYLLRGGIVFSSPAKKSIRHKVPNDYIYTLYTNKTEAEIKNIGLSVKENKTFAIYTQEAISGLSDDALVRFHGFNIGQVIDIKLSYNRKMHQMVGRVLLELDTSVFTDRLDKNTTGEANFYQAVKEGLRAKIASLDPLTGAQYIDMTFNHHDGPGKITKGKRYKQIPMTTQSSTGMMTSLTEILDTINHLPLDDLMVSLTKVVKASEEPMENLNSVLIDLKSTMKNVNKFTSKKSFEVMPDELDKALREMTRTLKNTSKVVNGYGNKSLAKHQLIQTLEVLTKTSQEMQMFLRMLNRKPNSLIFGDK
ncbi:MAG: MCE family protein [Sulfurovum sp.]|nr:MCE family protein [Sulfurovum sp.]